MHSRTPLCTIDTRHVRHVMRKRETGKKGGKPASPAWATRERKREKEREKEKRIADGARRENGNLR